MTIDINASCIRCAKCVKGCPFGAITLVEGFPVVGPECTLCGACVDICPVGAITLDIEQAERDLSAYRGVWVLGQRRGEVFHPVVYELVGRGRRLADALEQPLTVLAVGSNNDRAIASLAGLKVDRVLSADDPKLADYDPQRYACIAAELIRRYRPAVLLAGATPLGRGLAPRIATLVKTGLTADCTGLEIDPETGDLLQTRPAFGGNIMATIVCRNFRPQMATVRPKVFKPATPVGEALPEVDRVEIDPLWLESRQTFIERIDLHAEGPSLAEAEIIVAGGKGLGGAEAFDWLERIARPLGGVVAGSRSAVDAGWIDYSRQVGQTGKTVQPRLYVAVGISGAVQHLVGMQSSETIVAINSDPHAPIFTVADVAVVGDYKTVLPKLTELIGALRRGT